MMIWLSIRFPKLSIEARFFNQQNPIDLEHKPLVILTNKKIYSTNQCAEQKGIKIGQSLSSALAFCDDLFFLERDLTIENQFMENIAHQLYDISPSICLTSPALAINSLYQQSIISIEIGRSIKLYHDIQNIIQIVSDRLMKINIQYQFGIADNQTCARLLSMIPSNSKFSISSLTIESIQYVNLKNMIDDINVDFIEVEQKTIDRLKSVGILKLGDIEQFPSQSINQRFGLLLQDYLLKLSGRKPETFDYYALPETFYQKLDFHEPVHHRNGLSYPIKNLVVRLIQYLRIKQKQCQQLIWTLIDIDKKSISFEVILTESVINEKMLVDLTLLNLERFTLHGPIDSISLSVNQLCDINLDSMMLFNGDQSFQENLFFIQKIKAKFGQESCYQIKNISQHVPELASRTTKNINSLSVNEQAKDYLSQSYIDAHTVLDFNQQPTRPAWLLENPIAINYNQRKLLWHGELQIISSQETISHYWWKKKISRDYYLAEHQDGTLYWVFFDQIKQRWFLHGLYS